MDAPAPSHSGSSREIEQLQAYLASALTALGAGERARIFEISDVIAEVCQSCGIALYEPRKITDPVHHPDISDTEVFRLDRQRVVRSDLVIYLADQPSTGAGQELVFATEAMTPIVVVAQSDLNVSRMVTGMPGRTAIVRYSQARDLRTELTQGIVELRPTLEQRRRVLREYTGNGLGSRIRELREARGMTYQEVARAVRIPGGITAQQIRLWEQSSDRDNNMSILFLRELAAALGASAADLVE
ncbi:ribosome-binding protein aMBF1 (putative translation factor) [Streptacidiphilus sp. MAP12-16]|uniref:helix-turn-helix transcriptional regulator n=1 Tax=Streptacidiphilus sp. MAP12-16 TaxID=3156300 RepID=UPI0035122089